MASEENEPRPQEEQEQAGATSVIPEKHPLQNKWALWYFKTDKNKDWKDCLKKVIEFDTVEDFWSVFNHIKPPSQIASGCDYMVFKEGIEPMWEDKRNKQGGRWLLNLEKRDRRDFLDQCWLETIMCLVGESFDDASDEVCGAVVQIRNKGDKVAIWTGNQSQGDEIRHIGRTYKDKLSVHRRVNLAYQAHSDVISKTGSVSKSRFTV